MNKKLDEVSLVEVKLERKGWGPGPLEFLQRNTADQKALAEACTTKSIPAPFGSTQRVDQARTPKCWVMNSY